MCPETLGNYQDPFLMFNAISIEDKTPEIQILKRI